MSECIECGKLITAKILYCPTCGSQNPRLIKEPEKCGFFFLIINSPRVPSS